jgi:hypothetical protein
MHDDASHVPNAAAPPRLNRRDASRYLLAAHGLAVAPGTLARKASAGGGPRFARAGRAALYTPADLDAWAAETLSPTVATASELKR